MLSTKGNRKDRPTSTGKRATTAAAAGVAVLAATALTAGAATTALPTTPTLRDVQVRLAAYDQVDITLTGPLTGLADALGLLPESFAIDLFQTQFNFAWTNSNASNVYNTLNKLPMEPTGNLVCGDGAYSGGKCRMAMTIADTFGVYGAADAFRAFWSTAAGNDMGPGFPPITQAGLTSVLQVLVNNPLRPNGGAAARLAPLMRLLGTNPDLVATGSTAIKGLPNSDLAQNLIDVTWEYNPMGDAPVTGNPFSQINSFMANLPPLGFLDLFTGGGSPLDLLNQMYFTKGIGGETVVPGDVAGGGFFSLLSLYLAGNPDYIPPQWTKMFLTFANPDMPILTPIRLPGILTNLLLKRFNSPYLLGNPVADALNPMMKILVNIGYPDVITPAALANNPALAEAGFGAYDRTFTQTAQPVQFGSVDPLTPADRKALPGDIWDAFVTGVKEQFAKPFWGILVPNPDIPPAGAVTPAAKVTSAQAVSPAPAAATPLQQAPVSTPAPVEAPPSVAPVADEPAPVSAPKPDLSTALSAVDDEPAAPAAPAHQATRGATAATGDSGPGASQGAGANGGQSHRR